MKFSAKTEYGLRAALDLAYYYDECPIQLKRISRRERIPERFLEQVMSMLRCAGLVESVRGAKGGYILSRRPEKISLSEVVIALEGPINIMECVTESPSECEEVPMCVIRDVWSDVQKSLMATLSSISLKDLCEQRAKRETKSRKPEMYHI